MEINNLIAFLSVAVTGTVAVVGIIVAEKRHKKQLEFERRSRQEQIENERNARDAELEREKERENRHRIDVPQIEFDLGIGLIKKKGDKVLVEFLIILNNKGNVKQDIRSVKLRIRTINQGDEFDLWEGRGYRLEFPHKLFEAEIIPEGFKFVFVEPHVRQVLNYTTIVPEDVEILTARAEFSYGLARKGSRGSKHSVERVFSI